MEILYLTSIFHGLNLVLERPEGKEQVVRSLSRLYLIDQNTKVRQDNDDDQNYMRSGLKLEGRMVNTFCSQAQCILHMNNGKQPAHRRI